MQQVSRRLRAAFIGWPAIQVASAAILYSLGPRLHACPAVQWGCVRSRAASMPWQVEPEIERRWPLPPRLFWPGAQSDRVLQHGLQAVLQGLEGALPDQCEQPLRVAQTAQDVARAGRRSDSCTSAFTPESRSSSSRACRRPTSRPVQRLTTWPAAGALSASSRASSATSSTSMKSRVPERHPVCTTGAWRPWTMSAICRTKRPRARLAESPGPSMLKGRSTTTGKPSALAVRASSV